MKLSLQSALVFYLQSWLEDNADEIGASSGIIQDTTDHNRNAVLMMRGCELVIDAMALQNELEHEVDL